MMTKSNKSLFLVTFGLAILTGLPVHAADNTCRMGDGFLDKGIGATGNMDDTKKGLGGTGLRADNGIGGTGFSPAKPESIYIKGTIYAYGSICVNGLRITYDDSTPVSDGNGETKAKDLKLGQFVHILAEPVSGSTSLAARSIDVEYVVEGPITRINPAQDIINVMHETVVVRSATMQSLAVGQAVRVSGLRDAAGRIAASLIEPKPAPMPDSIAGRLTFDSAGQAFVGTTPIVMDKTAIDRTSGPVTVSGEWKDGALIAQTVADEVEGHREADYVSVEGYAENKNGKTYVQGKVLAGQHFDNGERVIISGRHDGDGKVDVRTFHESSDPETHVHDGYGNGDAGHRNGGSDSEGKSADSAHASTETAHDDADDQMANGKNEHSHGDFGDASRREDGANGSKSSIDRIDGNGRGSGRENSFERVEKSESVEKVEKVETIEKVEKVEKIEIEKPEKIEKIEVPKPEKPDTDSHSGRGNGRN